METGCQPVLRQTDLLKRPNDAVPVCRGNGAAAVMGDRRELAPSHGGQPGQLGVDLWWVRWAANRSEVRRTRVVKWACCHGLSSGHARAAYRPARKGKRGLARGASAHGDVRSGQSGRSAVDAATQHVETAYAAGLAAQLQRQERGSGRHVRRQVLTVADERPACDHHRLHAAGP